MLDDCAADKLTAKGSMDWFWANANDMLELNLTLGEKVGIN
jgi:hypothetical protein